eukprot:scaffold9515_cov136-Skeletonema_dohrnii-CCMP3373.AAC.7
MTTIPLLYSGEEQSGSDEESSDEDDAPVYWLRCPQQLLSFDSRVVNSSRTPSRSSNKQAPLPEHLQSQAT